MTMRRGRGKVGYSSVLTVGERKERREVELAQARFFHDARCWPLAGAFSPEDFHEMGIHSSESSFDGNVGLFSSSSKGAALRGNERPQTATNLECVSNPRTTSSTARFHYQEKRKKTQAEKERGGEIETNEMNQKGTENQTQKPKSTTRPTRPLVLR